MLLGHKITQNLSRPRKTGSLGIAILALVGLAFIALLAAQLGDFSKEIKETQEKIEERSNFLLEIESIVDPK